MRFSFKRIPSGTWPDIISLLEARKNGNFLDYFPFQRQSLPYVPGVAEVFDLVSHVAWVLSGVGGEACRVSAYGFVTVARSR